MLQYVLQKCGVIFTITAALINEWNIERTLDFVTYYVNIYLKEKLKIMEAKSWSLASRWPLG